MQHEMTIGSGKATSNPDLVAKLVLKEGMGRDDMAENYRSDILAHELFQEMAQDTPRRTALVCQGRELSYEELNGRANQLARYLRELGAGPEVLVAICMDRSVDVAISIVATLKAGAAYLPLDPAYPKERLAYMVADAKPRIVITHQHLQATLPEHAARVVVIDNEWPAIAERSAADLPVGAGTEDLAYVIYTSGSTGRPKGVMITHGNLGHYVQSMRVPLGLNSADAYLHTASISFSSSVRQLMLPLSLGAKIAIATTEQIRDPLALFELIKQQAITVIDIVPSYWRTCIHTLASAAPAERESLLRNNLRLVLSASEPLPADVPHEWRFSLRHSALLINMFGQTETAGIVATYPIPRAYKDHAKVVPIGRAIPHTQIYLLDSNLQPVPEGVPGEVHIGGPGVGRGYLHQAELTAAKFIPDPFRDTANARLYKTGDLARVGPDGHIQFLGRMDNQVKIRGHRVEPGEIEAVLRQLPRVQDATVLARKEDENDPRLIAYVVPEPAHAPVISGRARYELPNHMAIVQQNKHETDFFYQQIFIDQTNFRHGITLCDGDTVFDVGANIGMFALFAQQVRQNVSVYAFEPIPPIFEALTINASLYGDDVKLFQCGLAEISGEAQFTFYPNSSSQSGRYADSTDEREVLRTIIGNTGGIANTGAQDSNGSEASAYLDQVVHERVQGTKVTCQLKTLSQVIREHKVERIDLLKIDVEKSELDVLAGIADSDWPKIKQIVIEAHDVNGNLARLTTLLQGRGYSVVAEQDEYLKGSNLYNVFAVHRTDSDLGKEFETNVSFAVPVLPETLLTGAELRKHMQQKLPDYLWPSTFMIMESLPRLPNGKVDRQALPAPPRDRAGSDVTFIPARNSAEESLVKIWSEVLKLDRISVDDNFFDLGGDSILSAQIVARARQAGLRLTPKHLFKYQTIAELALVLQGSQATRRHGTKPTGPDYPRDKCVHELFEDQVQLTPEAVALRHEATVLSYTELNRRANQLAHRLRAMKVGPESLVGIYLERSVEMMVAVLGVLKAGGAYVPLDPAYPQSSISFMIEDAELSVLVTQESLLPTITRPDLKSVCLDGQNDKLEGESSQNLSSETTPENLAYVIYTSGSTGKPKGVMIPHRGLVNYLSWAIKEYDVAGGCGAPVHSSIAFDLTITSLFTPLLVGQSLHLLSDDKGVDALAHGLIQEGNFSLIKITPTHLRALSATLPPAGAAGRTRALVIGGEALTMESLAFWRKHAPATRLINEYGPTETVVGCCVYEVRPEDPSSGATPIGRPIANTQLYVLDERRAPVAAGVAGELYIGGDGVARGYLNRPELTKERFIPDPFSSESGARLYKTGDMARYRADGALEFLGRIDDQVKIRGYRIELGEIELTLAQHQNVRACAVVAREDVPGDRRLVAYVVSVNDEALTVTQLRTFLKERLPDYMVPSGFVLLDALPVTINGKVDRKALPPPVGERPDLEPCFAAARTPVEEVMVQIWAEVLKLERVGIYDNFFELGGDSILGTQILARTARAGLRLKPKQLFQYQTIAGLSAVLPAVYEPDANSAKPATESQQSVSGAADRRVVTSRSQTGLNGKDIDKVLARINRASGGGSHAN